MIIPNIIMGKKKMFQTTNQYNNYQNISKLVSASWFHPGSVRGSVLTHIRLSLQAFAELLRRWDAGQKWGPLLDGKSPRWWKKTRGQLWFQYVSMVYWSYKHLLSDPAQGPSRDLCKRQACIWVLLSFVISHFVNCMISPTFELMFTLNSIPNQKCTLQLI